MVVGAYRIFIASQLNLILDGSEVLSDRRLRVSQLSTQLKRINRDFSALNQVVQKDPSVQRGVTGGNLLQVINRRCALAGITVNSFIAEGDRSTEVGQGGAQFTLVGRGSFDALTSVLSPASPALVGEDKELKRAETDSQDLIVSRIQVKRIGFLGGRPQLEVHITLDAENYSD